MPPEGLWKFVTWEKAKILACSLIESEFAYCSLIWMFRLKIDMQRVERDNKYKTIQVVITITWLHMMTS